MPNIELIYDSTCPNVPATRQRLAEVLAELGMAEAWTEWERSSPDAPAHAFNYGSPTILNDGEDVAGETGSVGRGACRVYVDPESGRFGGIPSVASLRAAVERGRT